MGNSAVESLQFGWAHGLAVYVTLHNEAFFSTYLFLYLYSNSHLLNEIKYA